MRHCRIVRLYAPVLLAVFLALQAFAQTDPPDAPMKVSEIAITTRIIHGGPVDSVRRISSASAKTLYCYTRVLSPDDQEREITHVWYYEGEVVGEYALPVKGAHWRTYSKKVVSKGMRGDWRVDAVDGEGNVLGTVKFRMN
jgi:hypothetical protein